MAKPVRIFIGFDSAQAIASQVLEHSIRKHAKRPVNVIHLRLDEMKARGFNRPLDPLQSTEFTYTRFLVPWLCGYEGTALFMDSDMLALADITELFDLDMGPYALRVVKHEHQPADGIKMGKLAKPQSSYPRKNWSSLMLMDCAKLRCWTKEAAETQSGAWLHRFEPVPDAQIGDIDGRAWNVLDRYDENTKLIHYTSGGPWTSFGDVWFDYKADMEAKARKGAEASRRPIWLWNTGHQHNEAIVAAMAQGFRSTSTPFRISHASLYGRVPNPSMSYGVLRGVDRIYKDCAHSGVEWWNIDHGFFRRSDHDAGRYDGYYRIGRNALMPIFRPEAASEGSRWKALKISPAPWSKRKDGPVLLLPPTEAMGAFYGVAPDAWVKRTVARMPKGLRKAAVVRKKTDPVPFSKALGKARGVVVFNSNAAMEALVAGVPAVADQGIVRSWNGLGPEHIEQDFTKLDREALFRFAAECQFTLDEIRSGYAWRRCVELQR